MSNVTRRDLISRISGSGIALTSGTQAAASLGAKRLSGNVFHFDSLAGLPEAQDLKRGDVAMTPAGHFRVVPPATFEENGSTVFALPAVGLQAVLAPEQPIEDVEALRDDTRLGYWFREVGHIHVRHPHLMLEIIGWASPRAHITTRGGVYLAADPNAIGQLPTAAFDLSPAQAVPDPRSNAQAFQAWVNAHPDFLTLDLPAWEIPLGAPIDLGKRSVRGQGHTTRLIFSDLGGQDDAVTLGSGIGHKGGRAGKISDLAIDMKDSGRDAVRFTGGLGCGATFVTAANVGRDAFHFEQETNNEFFERGFLEDCEAREVGRYGLCIRLAPFGTDDVQFFNKSRFRDTRLTNCRLADVAILLHDNNGPGSRTKIGGGIKFDNFHAQFRGPGPTRRGSAVYIERASTSDAFIDWMTFEDCTFEWNFDEGNASRDGALEVVNRNGSEPLIYDFSDKMTILTNYFRWWDYNIDPAPVLHTYDVRNPQLGIYTNIPDREFGTPSAKPGTQSVPGSGATTLFDASEAGAVWLATARVAFNAGTRVTAIIYGGPKPDLDWIAQTGNLSLQINGTRIQATNAGSAGINIYWSVSRLSS
ncbi:MAG: hypothetical protein AAGA47_00905 [Pseudomonadota bacterium]